ncbi:AbiH family protein [Acinetobacter gerneri]|jgi:hypothetical protein|uniref:AbiH family protein n=1 Tax=Acinetobacter gerneri TaxID=202952 RepID=UPI0023EFB2E3|nr:AbiH family protein [Acinetobacter gerneri]MCH4243240.1 bacteriophage abortive infection AbiH family protein [Acinetobacter gerneri]
MNILIVGNGFDLSHYLPTKYDHFMVAMNAIENWDESHEGMTFDDLFCKDYWYKDKKTGEEYQNVFFQYTKAMYYTNEIRITLDQITELKKQLKENVWYQYFSDHVREVKTWIDFETKINEALKVVAIFILKLEKKQDDEGNFSHQICFYGKDEDNQIFLTREHCNILEKLKILISSNYDNYNENFFTDSINIDDPDYGDLRFYINDQHIQYYSGFGKLNNFKLLNQLQIMLDNFIVIFNTYLEILVSKLSRVDLLSIDSKDWLNPDKIFSFNYTNTYQRIHDSIEVEYLHGSHGEHQNIVLGVSDLENESLKKIKAYGFTKYHQKLFKDTDYLFLDFFKEKVKIHKKRVEYFEKDFGEKDPIAKKFERQTIMEVDSKLNLNISIWGHSLDVSDKDYVIDLFSLNDDLDRNVRVIVYYFDNNAKFSLLNNLLAILGKDKVEHWMKKKWLQFKENPKIVAENPITLEDLPKR